MGVVNDILQSNKLMDIAFMCKQIKAVILNTKMFNYLNPVHQVSVDNQPDNNELSDDRALLPCTGVCAFVLSGACL